MKTTIGAKIRAVLEKYPEVKRRRAQLNAVGYLLKRDKNATVQWHPFEKSVTMTTYMSESINMKSLSEYLYTTYMSESINMKSLSEYLYSPPVTQVVNGDTLKGPMLVFKDNKFEIVP